MHAESECLNKIKSGNQGLFGHANFHCETNFEIHCGRCYHGVLPSYLRVGDICHSPVYFFICTIHCNNNISDSKIFLVR